MGWEYRIFFIPNDPNSTLLLPHQAPHLDAPRNDRYYVHSADVGIKKRGGEILEVKLRSKIDDKGFEKWTKWKINNFEELKTVLHKNGFSDSLMLSGDSLVFVSIGKKRRIGFRENMQIEETDLVIRCGRDGNDGDDGEDELWKTIAIEGRRSACVEAKDLLMEKCRIHAANGDIRECGYAEFVSKIAAAKHNK
mmetsp:Transcript_35536/g.47049  ORF Transcript_35536/g.47049 Transcript_35536/m.47049 type:complete len:194 (+) Transcript_35536:37-618(+)